MAEINATLKNASMVVLGISGLVLAETRWVLETIVSSTNSPDHNCPARCSFFARADNIVAGM